jgi:hypothetical protein
MSNRYDDELEELSTLVYDALVDLEVSIDIEGPCSAFEARQSNPVACSWCAFDDEEH